MARKLRLTPFAKLFIVVALVGILYFGFVWLSNNGYLS